MSARLVTSCDICGSPKLEPVMSLGTSPPTCAMARIGERPATEEHHPLDLLWCNDCKLAQLSVAVDPGVVFAPDYTYSSGNSGALHANFDDLRQQVEARIGGIYPSNLVVDVGANDGTLLGKFHGCRKVGVEPTDQARKIAAPYFQGFFGEDVARRIVDQYGQAHVVTACNVMAHCDDVHDFMRGVSALLVDDGLFVAENHDLISVTDGMQWDTIYHEHRRYYSRQSFRKLLAEHDFGVMEWRDIPTHGGSFRTLAAKGIEGPDQPAPRPQFDFQRLSSCARDARAALRRACNIGLWGIGATARATTIVNYCGLDVEDVAAVAEVPGSDKLGHYVPGTRIPVVEEGELIEKRPQGAILFSWHLADMIVPQLRERGYVGTVVVPLPTLRYL